GVAWKVLAIFVRAAARASVAVGDGIDVALVKDDGGIEMISDTAALWEETERVVDQMVALFRMRMEVPEVVKWMEEVSESPKV
ncbi:MAG: hypothetical protein WBC61_01635, partial [Dehalococcoidia bacterium]